MAPDMGANRGKGSGVRISTDLTFSMQIDMVVESGSCIAGWAQEES